MIEARGVTKRYGDKTAVDDLTFTVRPGVVTGFLGPNGAGKSTTMRMILGLDSPTSGEVTVNGKRYVEHSAPLHEAGPLLEAHGPLGLQPPAGSRADHRHPASSGGRGDRPAGLRDVARRRVGGFSLGMGQRLGVAAALLGDPATLVLDEPVNGLDPEGILWVRNLLRALAAEGRTVFVSSHLMSEMALTAEHLVAIGRGRMIADVSVREFTDMASSATVRVRTPEDGRLRDLLVGADVSVPSVEPGVLEVTGLTSEAIGRIACDQAVPLVELTPVHASLGAAFMELTQDAVEFRVDTEGGKHGTVKHGTERSAA